MSRMYGKSVFDVAKGQWRGILMAHGVPEKSFGKAGGPCPTCGGTDRWSFMRGNNPNGVSHCRQCGNGEGRTGMQLLQDMTGWEFKVAASKVEEMCGQRGRAAPVPKARSIPTEEETDARNRKMKNDLWAASSPVVKGDQIDVYLAGRGVDQPSYCRDLRYCPSAYYAPNRYLPAMVAMVRDAAGNPVNLHRTYLANGKKLDAQDCRKAMPGKLPDGCAIRLSPVNSALGIAEGIETAFAASDRFGLPVWSAMNRVQLGKWIPPEGVEEVAIFPDNDANGAGQGDADRLAERLIAQGLTVSIHLPPRVDTDWADYTGEK